MIHAQIIIDSKEQETWISVSENFRRNNIEKLAHDLYYDLQKEGNESPLEFAIRYGWELDVMRDFPVNNYIGSKSLEYNLSLIPKGYDLQIQELKTEDRDYIFKSIDNILSGVHMNKIWEMIWKRWCYFEKVRNQEK